MLSPSGWYLFFISDVNGDFNGPLVGHIVEIVHPTPDHFMLKEIDEIVNFDEFMHFEDLGGMDSFSNGWLDSGHDP